MYWIVEVLRDDGTWAEVGATLESSKGKAVKHFAKQFPGRTLRARTAR